MGSTLYHPKDISDQLPYVFLQLRGRQKQKIDLDAELLENLVDFFLRIQFAFWKEINETANKKFPGLVSLGEIEQVEHIVDRDDFIRLFGEYIPYYIFLTHFQAWRCTQKRPHLKPNDHYADHIAVIKHKKHNRTDYKLIYTEVKTTQNNARRRVKEEIFVEFENLEKGFQDRDIKEEVKALDWDFLESRQRAKELADSLFWKGNIHFHACVVSAKGEHTLFEGYDNAVTGDTRSTTKRRWALVVPIEKWDTWIAAVRDLVKARIQQVKAEGKI